MLKQLTLTIQINVEKYFNVGTTFKMQRIASVKNFTPLDKSMAIQNGICNNKY